MTDTSQLLAATFIVLLNLVATAIVYLEFRRTGSENIRLVLGAQLLMLCWHLVVMSLTLNPTSWILLGCSAVIIQTAFLCYVLAAMTPGKWNHDRILVSSAVTGAVVVFGGGLFVPALIGAPWLVTLLAMCALPFLTMTRSKLAYRWILVVLQVLIAFTFIGGMVALSMGPEAVNALGPLMYFFMMMLVPAASMVNVQESMNLSGRQLSAREQQLDDLFDSVGETFFQTDMDGNLIRCASSIEQFGHSRESLLQRPLMDILVDAGSFFEGVRESAIKDMPVKVLTATGEALECEVSASLDDSSGELRVTGSIRNVQQRKDMERHFIESQRRDSMGHLAGGVAHDFNNILQSMMINAHLGLRSSSEERVRARFNEIIESTTLASSICNQLMHYTGEGYRETVPVNLDAAITDVLKILRPSCPAGIEVEYLPGDSGVNTTGDPTQMRQIILNLVQNAVDATERGVVEVSLRFPAELPAEASDFVINETVEHDSGTLACIEVKDTGHGINAGDLGRIFDPFYTTRAEGHGLGLSAVRGILKNHHGILGLSTGEAGTTVQVLFPAQVGATVSPAAPREIPRKQSMVLYAEDNDSVRSSTTALLETRGLKVLAVRDGQEAVDTFMNRQDEIDLFISDVRMPVKDGIDAAREIRKIRSVPVILASGYSAVASRLTDEESRMFRFLQKPFKAEQLLTVIELVMEPDQTEQTT